MRGGGGKPHKPVGQCFGRVSRHCESFVEDQLEPDVEVPVRSVAQLGFQKLSHGLCVLDRTLKLDGECAARARLVFASYVH